MENTNNVAKQSGVKGRQGLYAYASKYSKEAIDVLYQLMTTSNNEGIRLGAAKALLNKCLPDLRATEDTIEFSQPPIPILGNTEAE